MKNFFFIFFISVFYATGYTDELVLKSGRRIEWRALRDRGDAYDVELVDGSVQTVQKKDVEKVETVEVKPVLTGASLSFGGKTKTFDLLAGVNPKRDTVFGIAKGGGTALSVASEIDAPTLVRIPGKVPEEYDLTLVIERKSIIGNFYVGLVGGGIRQFMLEFDGDLGISSRIVGGPTQKGTCFEKGKPRLVFVQVRNDAVVVSVDKKEYLVFKGSASALSAPSSHQLPNSEVSLFVGTQRIYGNSEHANFQISRFSMTTKP